jgi:Zn ribbon nucleic-acid-binding protein
MKHATVEASTTTAPGWSATCPECKEDMSLTLDRERGMELIREDVGLSQRVAVCPHCEARFHLRAPLGFRFQRS